LSVECSVTADGAPIQNSIRVPALALSNDVHCHDAFPPRSNRKTRGRESFFERSRAPFLVFSCVVLSVECSVTANAAAIQKA
jgi:hypothetical protein